MRFPFINKNAEIPIPFIVLSYRHVKSFSVAMVQHVPSATLIKQCNCCQNPLAAVPNMRTYSKGLMERELLDLMAKSLNFT